MALSTTMRRDSGGSRTRRCLVAAILSMVYAHTYVTAAGFSLSPVGTFRSTLRHEPRICTALSIEKDRTFGKDDDKREAYVIKSAQIHFSCLGLLAKQRPRL